MKRYAMLQSECRDSVTNFYIKAAKQIGITDSPIIVYDCRKIHVTKSVQNEIIKYYLDTGNSLEEINQILLMFGPKADLPGEGFEFVPEDGFTSIKSYVRYE